MGFLSNKIWVRIFLSHPVYHVLCFALMYPCICIGLDRLFTVYTSLLAAFRLPETWPVFCLRLIHATYPEGQSFHMSEQILWTDVFDNTCDTDEDDTYDDLQYL